MELCDTTLGCSNSYSISHVPASHELKNSHPLELHNTTSPDTIFVCIRTHVSASMHYTTPPTGFSSPQFMMGPQGFTPSEPIDSLSSTNHFGRFAVLPSPSSHPIPLSSRAYSTPTAAIPNPSLLFNLDLTAVICRSLACSAGQYSHEENYSVFNWAWYVMGFVHVSWTIAHNLL